MEKYFGGQGFSFENFDVQGANDPDLLLQDPVIFSGSVRSNLDPFGEAAGDEAIWDSLRQAGLEALVHSMPVLSLDHTTNGRSSICLYIIDCG